MYSMKWMNGLLMAGVIGLTGLLAGCGGGGAGGSSSGGGSTTTVEPAVSVILTDTSDVSIDTLTSGITGKLTATVTDANGDAVSGALVTFSTNSDYGTFNPGSGTALTNSSGVATMQISGGSTSGASTVTVTAVWKESGEDVSVTDALNYIVSASGAVSLTVSTPTFGVSPLSAYGTTSVSVTVGGTNAPVVVSFTSTCASSGRAVLTPIVTTVNNIATASYLDNGCGNTDTVTASVTSGLSASSTLTVSAPTVSSIQFVSATPTVISLRGTGSTTAPETSTVKFKVLDSAGNPISRTVNFALSTALGGITFSSGATTASATSDATTGEVQIVVNSGTLPTPVRVFATISGTTITTQSNQLSISTGLPDQVHTSLSASTFNIDGWRFDGTQTTLTIHLADHLSNPVPDGTVVNFVAEGSIVQSSCVTTNSVCTVSFSSLGFYPSDGRITVLAYAIGEESFTDLNSNGTVDNVGEMIDSNSATTDIGEAFVDYDEDGVRDSNEPYFDFDASGTYRAAGDGEFNGVLCTTGATICSATPSLHVNDSLVIVLSDSQPVLADIFDNVPSNPLDLGGCANKGGSFSFNLLLRDVNNNPLPAGTIVTVTSTNGDIDLGGSAVVPNTNVSYLVDPTHAAFNFPVTIVNDAPTTGTCEDSTLSGTLTVKIDPPRGATVEYSISVID